MKKFLSLVFFFCTFITRAQTVAIIQPNGSEVLYTCQAYTIMWSQSGSVSNYWNIDYSLDGGTIWTSVTSNYLATTGTFIWTIPTIQSNTVLVRVKDALNASVVDQSNNVFTINIPVTLVAPNGGEVWQAATTQTISWNSTGLSNLFTLRYSLNNGSSWNTIATNYSTTTFNYPWLIPSTPSNSCLVQVYNQSASCAADQSNSTFTISPPTPILLSPNGGESLQVGCTYSINWVPSSFYSSIDLYYSTNSGFSWNTIINNTANDGNYMWVAPNAPSGFCMIKAANTADAARNDVSNSTFTIQPAVTVNSPNGSETWYGCNSYTITWTKSPCVGGWYIYTSSDNGLNWSMINSVSDNGSTQQSYVWVANNNITSNQMLVRIASWSSSPQYTDDSDGSFNLNPSIDIAVLTPNGGQNLIGGSTYVVTWTNTANTSGLYRVTYSHSGSDLVSSTSANSFTWVVPNNPPTVNSARIYVYDASNNCKYDQSDNTFTVTYVPPTPTLTSPNGGQTLQVGCGYSITWNTAGFYSNVNLYYSTDNGANWNTIVTNTSNDGNHAWSIPNMPSTTCLVKAANSADVNVFDVSNSVFTIQQPLQLISPNGGESWNGCGTYSITWTKSPCLGSWNLYYSTNNGSTWQLFNSLSDNGSSSQTFFWTQIPNNINSSQVLMRVANSNSPTIYVDNSDAPFSINSSNDITLVSPNGGQNLTGGSTYVITWTNTANTSGTYAVSYSSESGGSLLGYVTGNSYTWTVPNISPTKIFASVNVSDLGNGCRYDASDNTFTITYVPPTPTLTSPNGGESLQVGCTYSINWIQSSFYSNVDLYYSINNGTTWNSIVNNTTNDGNYMWAVPNIVSNTCLIKAANVADNNMADVSNATFTVNPVVNVISPNGSETWYGCNSYTITWTKSPCVSGWYIYTSTDNGLNWSMINSVSDNGSTQQSYVWVANNNITSAQMLVKVTNWNTPAYTDESDASFTLTPSIDVTVLTPNGGQNLLGGSNCVITWTNSANTSGLYRVVYSHGGSDIVTSTSAHSFTWAVPNVPPTINSARIYVYDVMNSCKYDMSDNSFTVTYVPPTPTLTAPNGGQTLQVGCGYSITWNTAGFYSNVNLYYSTDNGLNWNTIVTNTSNDGNHAWSIPNMPSTTCLVKAANSADVNVFDVSNSVFTIQQPLQLISPNGGESWSGCGTYSITWTKSPCLGSWNLYYSTNNGSTWQLFTSLSDNGSTSQTFFWTQIPNNINSSQVLMRVANSNSPTIYVDNSDAPFSINSSNDITLVSPNGGQNLTGGSTYVITWTNTANTSGTYAVSYSSESGGSLLGYVTGNSYTWTVPNISPTKIFASVNVSDLGNGCRYDASDNTFTITYVPPTPTLTSPNGGESLQVGCTYSINWIQSSFYSNVDLYYSINNGTTWNSIVNNTTNDGNYMWAVPNIVSNTCLIKAANVADNNMADVSNASFTVNPVVNVISPNGSETWYGCNSYTITWTKSPCVSGWYIYTSTDNGLNWSMINSVSDNGSTQQSYVWVANNNITSTQMLVKVTNWNTPAYTDESDASFTLTPSIDVTVLTPNGGQNLLGGSNCVITWTNSANTSGLYRVVYSHGGSDIVTSTSAHSFTWAVPNVPPTINSARIYVYDVMNSCKYDMSDNSFTVTYVPPSPTLTAPNGGQVLYSGTGYNITWNTAGFYSNVNLYYSLNNGATWNTIVTNTSNDGNEAWSIPITSSSLCLVKAANFADVNVFDVSNSTFTILPPVQLLTPNGDNGVTEWRGCTITSITFERSPAWSTYSISYSLNNGVTWNTITSNFNTGANPATYNWNIPNSPTGQALVRVTQTSANYSDQSDNTFTITKPVTIIQPNFGGIMQVGSVYPIKWSSDGISNIYDIFYSTNGGASFVSIAAGYTTSTNTFSWTVPATVSNNCKIFVRDNINTCKSDTSDIPFVIQTAAPALALTYPNGLDTLRGCAIYTVTWVDALSSAEYNLAYSTDAGVTWNTIVSNYSTSTHSYAWSVPNTINSNNALMRVQMTNTLSNVDLSNSLLSILNRTLTASPSTSNICSGSAVQLLAVGGFNFNWMPASALSATNISNPVASPAVSTIYTVQSISGLCVLSNTVAINVTGLTATPALTITAQTSNTVCAGNPLTFTLNSVAQGSNPLYQWKLNGVNVGTNTPFYTAVGLFNNDVVSCFMSTSYSCALSPTAQSNAVAVTVNQVSSPSVSLLASPSTTVCSGSPVSFSAVPLFGGTAPSYQWRVNGLNQSTGSVFTSSVFSSGDQVSVLMNSNANCVSSTVAISPNVPITVISVPAQPGSIVHNSLVCSFSPYTLSVVPVPGASSYSWTLPTGWSGNSISNSLSLITFTNAGNVFVQAVSSCGMSAARNLPLQISAPTISVSGNQLICAQSAATLLAVGNGTAYSWSSGQMTGLAVLSPSANASYTVYATDVNGCQASAVAEITVNPSPLISISGNAPLCVGNSGTLSAAGALSYTWSTASQAPSIVVAPLANGPYSVVGTDGNGCLGGSAVNVTVIPLPNVTISGPSAFCYGTSAVLVAGGANTYTWNNSVVAPTIGITPSVSVSYTLSGTDVFGCGGNTSTIITVNPLPVLSTSGNSVICGGQAMYLSATGATSYTWTGGAVNNSTFIPAASGIYTVTGTDNNGCASTATVSAVLLPVPSVSATVAVPVVCSGYTTSIAAAGALSYTFSGGISDNTPFSPAVTTSYTITGAGSNACTNSVVKTVTVTPAPTVIANASFTHICQGENVLLYGSGATTYTWSGGLLNNSIQQPSITTVYSVTGSDLNGCFNSAQVTVSVSPYPNIFASASASAICFGDQVSLTATGAQSYTWSAGLVNAQPFSPSASSIYTVMGTNASGCVGTATQAVSVNPLPTVSVVSTGSALCFGNSTSLSGNGALIYQWSNGVLNGIPFTPSVSSVYTLIGTDANGCVNNVTHTLLVNSSPTVTAHATASSVCAGQPVTFFGAGASNYNWTGGINNNVPLVLPSSGVFTVTGIDFNGCSGSASIVLSVIPLPILSTTLATPVVCYGGTTAATAGGAATYVWSGGISNGSVFVPALTTNYTVTGTDLNGCSNTAQVLVTVNPLPIVSSLASNTAVCQNQTLSLNGTGALSYTWTGGVINNVAFTPTTSGTYTVSGTDINGCINSSSQNITVNNLPNVSANASAINVCYGSSTTLSGGGALTYSWSGGISNGVSFSPSVSANYVVSGSAANGCTNTANISVTVHLLPLVGASASSASVCLGSTVTLSGTGAFLYSWTGGISNATPFTILSSAIYTVTGTDVNGCTASASLALTAYSVPLVVANTNSQVICLGESTTLFGGGALNYTWTRGVSNNIPFTPLATTVYIVTGTDANGCSGTGSRTITVNMLPLVTASASNSITCSGSPVTLFGGGALTYSWSAGIVNAVAFNPTVSANYVVTGTAANGCTNTANTSVTVNPLPLVTAGVSSSTICAGVAVTFTGSGANTYLWNGGIVNGIPFTPGASTVYAVAGTDVNGCSRSASVNIVVYSLPFISGSSSNSLVCAGQTVSLNGQGGQSYVWSAGIVNGVPFTPFSTATYTVTGTDMNGCQNTATTSVSILSAPAVSASASSTLICSGQAVTLSGAGAITYSWTGGVMNGQPFNPSTTTIYTVSGTGPNGCQGSATKIISVHPLAQVLGIASSTAICSGESVSLSGSGAVSYTWAGGISNGANFFPTLSNSYTVSGTDQNGCTASGTVYVQVNALPAVNISGKTVVCKGEDFSLSATGANMYLWNTGAQSSFITITASATSVYSVVGTDQFGCKANKLIQVTVDECTGIAKTGMEQHFAVYPNPGTGHYILRSNGGGKAFVSNELGQLLFELDLQNEENELDLSSYDNGLYFVTVRQNNSVKVVKVIKQ